MKAGHAELPPDKEGIRRRAVRLEIISIVYLVTAATAVYLTLGNSQAMKTAWVEDLLSFIPPISFLFATRRRNIPPSSTFPYGHHRATSVAYLAGSVALLTFGSLILLDSVSKLVTFEHPSIGTVVLFDNQIWLGWLMLPALMYTGIPMLILGRMKLPLARALHDKSLYADARMMRADWLTTTAASLGVLGIAVGLWWADAVAASIISFSIVRDGWENLRQVTADLMDHVPTTVDHRMNDPLPARVEAAVRSLPWVKEARVRLREEGHVYFGEVFVVPSTQRDLLRNIERAHEEIRAMDWRLHDVVIAPTDELHDELEDVEENPS
jgi:cation diffusion facilitator family transporter